MEGFWSLMEPFVKQVWISESRKASWRKWGAGFAGLVRHGECNNASGDCCTSVHQGQPMPVFDNLAIAPIPTVDWLCLGLDGAGAPAS